MTHIHVIIQKQVGVDENDNHILETVDGYHIDTLESIEGAEDYLVYPVTPHHGFAGVALDDVYRYRFPTEADYEPFASQADE